MSRSASGDCIPLVRLRLVPRKLGILRPVGEGWRRDDGYTRYPKRWARYVPGLNDW